MKKIRRVRNLIAIIFAAVFLLAGCGQSSTDSTKSSEKSQQKVITDAAGQKVKVPAKIDKIADAWPAHNEMVTMLGAGNKIVSTISTPQSVPWLYKVNPQMKSAVTDFTNEGVNTEEVLKTKPDILFMPINSKTAGKVKELGIPTVQLNFTDFDSMKKTVKLTGEILGGDSVKRADKYVSYLDSKLKMVTDVTSKIPDSQKPKVLHIISFSPLTVDGKNTIIDSWIKAAGGINAASEITGNMKVTSTEQILKWNPDVIILGSNTLTDAKSAIKNIDQLTQNSTWSQINAVKNRKVYINPTGAFLWDRYGAEEALQIQWAAKTLHPDKFKNLDIVKETRNFYKTFLNYDLTEEEASKIINDKNPD